MSIWVKVGLVALGGAIGALSRTGISEWIYGRVGHGFAWGTLAVNLLGCLAIGMARAGVETVDWGSPQLRTLVFSGFLGAFTTFSTFEADAMTMWKSGERVLAGVYMGGSVVGGLIAYMIGWYLIARTAA